MSQPLAGIRVLDLSIGQQGPYAAMVLGDMGAEVIKIEPRIGDVARRIGVLANGVSTFFTANNRNKRSVRLDLSQPAGREVLLRLLHDADVLVENYNPTSLPSLGLDYDTVRQHNPRLIYASASGYGPQGPHRNRPSMDIIAQGAGGAMVANAAPGGTPQPAGFLLADQTGALVLVSGILLALFHRERTGVGQKVDTSLLGSQIALQAWEYTHYMLAGELDTIPRGSREQRPPLFTIYQAQDGWFTIAILDPRKWPVFCQAIDRPELADDPRFGFTATERSEHEIALRAILDAWFIRQPRAYWIETLLAADIACGPVQTYDEVINDPQTAANAYFTSYDHPVLGTIRVPGCPIQLGVSPASIRRPPPERGEHTEEVLQEYGYSLEEIAHFREIKLI